jgi:hypothetical protein
MTAIGGPTKDCQPQADCGRKNFASRVTGLTYLGVIVSTTVAFMICPSASPELVDLDANRKCMAYTNTFQEEAAANPVNCEQRPISFIV